MNIIPRLYPQNDRPVRGGDFVLYWMTSARRVAYNPALEHAAAHARTLGLPLVVFEAVDADAPWASSRTHAFLIDGMRENASALRARGVCAWPYVEPEAGAGRGLLARLASRAAVVVTDLYPGLHLPGILRRAGELPVRVEAVDGNGLVPLSRGGAYPSAYVFRRHVQRVLSEGVDLPLADPLRDLPPAPPDLLPAPPPLDLPRFARDVPALSLRGGATAARAALTAFLPKLPRYGEERNEGVASGLSPWLHFGHLSPFEVFAAVAPGWAPRAPKPTGKREGWWGLDPSTEAFLDELVTWRELGHQYCHHQPDFARYDTLPGWALATLEEHAADPRPHRYTLGQLTAAETHDEVWNAAQRQLVREGRIHNYLRMLWGKKVLEWSAHPREAWDVLIELNNRWAIDGRDPNSYSGIAWTFGRFDRPWGPERPIFGTIRYMSSDNTRRKMDLTAYLARYGA